MCELKYGHTKKLHEWSSFQIIVHVPEGGPDGGSRNVGVVDIGQARCTPESHF